MEHPSSDPDMFSCDIFTTLGAFVALLLVMLLAVSLVVQGVVGTLDDNVADAAFFCTLLTTNKGAS